MVFKMTADVFQISCTKNIEDGLVLGKDTGRSVSFSLLVAV